MARYDTDGSSALAPNDPYNNMERPNFKVINGGKPDRSNFKVIDGGKSNQSKDQANSQISRNNSSNDSQNLLKNSEAAALSPAEPSFYRGTGNKDNQNSKYSKSSAKSGGR